MAIKKLDTIKYIGVPYLHKGRSLKGLDCWGLPILIYRELFNVELLDFDDYEQDWSKNQQNHFLDNYHKQFEEIKNPEKYCLIFFLSRDKKRTKHAGIYIGEGKFLQCSKVGVIISRISVWKNYIQGYYKLKT